MQRRLSGFNAALHGAVGSIACLQSLCCTFPWIASGILRGPLAWPLTAQASEMIVTTWVTPLDILQGVRFHMLGRQWQMLDDMVAAKLRADAALGHAAQAGAADARHACWQASKTSGAAEKRKIGRSNRLCAVFAVWSVVHGLSCRPRLTRCVQRLPCSRRRSESVLSAGATERGVVSLAGGYRCALLRDIGHAGADAVVAHLDAGIARQTVCRWEQLLGANVLTHARAFCNDQYTRLHAARSAEVRERSRAGLDVGSARFARRRHQLEHLARIEKLTCAR